MEEEGDTICCDWCGQSPYYISVYENIDDEETFLCKGCYDEFKYNKFKEQN